MKRCTIKAIIALTLALIMVLSMVSTSMAYTVLKYRDKGQAVSTMQQALKNQGYYGGDVDGVFKGATLAAVKAFQKANGLVVDGCAGNNTLSKLYGTAPAPKPAPAPGTEGKPKSATTLCYGSMGARVTTLQKALTKLGVYSGTIDGVFGESTAKAVRVFQANNGLHADGMVGPKTVAKINSKQSSYKLTLASTLVLGMEGTEVAALQNKLKALGLYTGGDTDAVLGTNTINAVNAFQSNQGLAQTDDVTKSMYNRIINFTGAISKYTTLRKNATGAEVAALNAKLVSLGYAAPTGDKYTDDTVNAVKQFQKDYNLGVDGIAGPKTRTKLDSL